MSDEQHDKALEKSLKERLQEAELAPPSFQEMLGTTGVRPDVTFIDRLWNVMSWMKLGWGKASMLFWLLPLAMVADQLVEKNEKDRVNEMTTELAMPPIVVSKDSLSNNAKTIVISELADHEPKVTGNTQKRKAKERDANDPIKKLTQANKPAQAMLEKTKERKQETTSNIAIPVAKSEVVASQKIASLSTHEEEFLNRLGLLLATRKSKVSTYQDLFLQSAEAHMLLANGAMEALSFGKKKVPKGFIHLGVMGTRTNTWILNQNTYGQFGGRELPYKTTFGYAYGLVMGYQSFKGLGVEINLITESRKGQKYEDMIGNQLQQRAVELTYQELPIWLKYRFPIAKRKLRNVFIGPDVGFAVSKLTKAEEFLNNGQAVAIENRFKSTNWRVQLGFSSDIYLSRSWFVSIGVRGGISDDINANGWQVDDNYGKSHNLDWGLQMSLNYRFLRKNP